MFAGIATLRWLDTFHLTAAAILLLMAEVARRLAPVPAASYRSRRTTIDRPAARPDLFQDDGNANNRHEVIRGLLQGLALLGLLAAISSVISVTPGLAAMVLDRDRVQLETKLAALQEAGDWRAAAALISHRLERCASREWRNLLYQRQYDSLISAGTAAAKREEAEPFFQQALQVARDHGLNPDLAVANLDRVHLRHAYDRQRQSALDLRKGPQRQAELNRAGAQAANTLRQNADLQAQIEAGRAEIERLRQYLTNTQSDMAKAVADHTDSLRRMGISRPRFPTAALRFSSFVRTSPTPRPKWRRPLLTTRKRHSPC